VTEPTSTADDIAEASARELAARGHAGLAVRDLGHALVGHNNPEELLEMVAMSVEAMAVQLARGSHRSRPGRDMQNRAAEPPPADGEVFVSHPDRPISGAASPWGVDLEVTREGTEVVGRCTLRAAHEGAPGRSHGGVVAATFDDLFGFVLTVAQIPAAFTGELTVRYVAGTPLFQELVLRARLVGQERRKLFITGEMHAGEQLIATAAATFIRMPEELIGVGG
jgi:acyl-coenzyme A thioesterase PaaI-like protein